MSQGDSSRYDGTLKELLLPVWLFAYAAPGVAAMVLVAEYDLLVLGYDITTPSRTTRFAFVAVSLVIASLGFLYQVGKSGGQDTPQSRWPTVETSDIPTTDQREHEAILTEYEIIAAEARYRDRLLLRTGYFSLAAFAALTAVFVRPFAADIQPGIALVGSLVSLAFAIAVNSYKDARDPLWDRMRYIELHYDYVGLLTVFHTIRTNGERRGFDHISLSGYLMNLQVFFLLVWIGLYVLSSLQGLQLL